MKFVVVVVVVVKLVVTVSYQDLTCNFFKS